MALCSKVDDFKRQRDFFTAIRDLGLGDMVKLPSIAVMGDTSSGKSSVLSAVSGIEFPTHSDLCTRCPIEVAMTHAPTEAFVVQAKGSSAAGDDEDFRKQCPELSDVATALTEAKAFVLAKHGFASGVTDHVVSVQLEGPQYLDLTLIDLPGSVQVVGDDDHPDLPRDIQAINEAYLRNERCILLVVVPANVDFHNSGCLRRAKEVDPETLRTIPVVTKADLTPEGGERGVTELMAGRRIAFAQGFFIVRGRSSKDVDEGMSLAASLRREENFFRDPRWAEVQPQRRGVAGLTTTMCDMYRGMVEDTVPSLLDELASLATAAEEELRQLGVSLATTADRRAFFTTACAQVHERLNLERRWGKADVAMPASDIRRFAAAFQRSLFAAKFTCPGGPKREEDPDEEQQAEDEAAVAHRRTAESETLMEMVTRTTTLRLTPYPSPEMIEAIVAVVVERDFRPPAELLVQRVFDTLQQVLDRALEPAATTGQFPNLKHYVKETLAGVLREARAGTDEAVEKVLEREATPLTFNDHFAMELRNARLATLQRSFYEKFNDDQQTFSAEQVRREVNEILRGGATSLELEIADALWCALDAYGKVAIKNFGDELPKLLRQEACTCAKRFHAATVRVSDEDLLRVLAPDRGIEARRVRCADRLDALHAAQAQSPLSLTL